MYTFSLSFSENKTFDICICFVLRMFTVDILLQNSLKKP